MKPKFDKNNRVLPNYSIWPLKVYHNGFAINKFRLAWRGWRFSPLFIFGETVVFFSSGFCFGINEFTDTVLYFEIGRAHV